MAKNTKMFTPERSSLLLLATALLAFLLYKAYGPGGSPAASSPATEVNLPSTPQSTVGFEEEDSYPGSKRSSGGRPHKKSRKKKGSSKGASGKKTKTVPGKKRDHRNEPVPSF